MNGMTIRDLHIGDVVRTKVNVPVSGSRIGRVMELSQNSVYLDEKGYFEPEKLEGISLTLDAPEVLSYTINRSEWFNVPVEVTGTRLSAEAKEMLSRARRDETVYIDEVRVLLPDGRTVTLKAEFPLK